MRHIDMAEIIKRAIRFSGKPSLYLAYYSEEETTVTDESVEVRRAAPYLTQAEALLLVADGGVLLEFEDAAEMQRCYQLTVGDDGPTATNPYAGSARVYACSYSALGQLLTENT